MHVCLRLSYCCIGKLGYLLTLVCGICAVAMGVRDVVGVLRVVIIQTSGRWSVHFAAQ